jgi:hypothetical protein
MQDRQLFVMAGLVPAIHVVAVSEERERERETWLGGG